ncbi:hypothetical protein YerA41_174c [Yersinia phage YerA41]|nr:hypothetical protein YerA41_174c [Yersinia phage YerA41]
MSDVIALPNEEIFSFYEGSDPEQFSDLTGQNLNRAAKQLLANQKYLRNKISALITGADIYDPATTYDKYSIVKPSADSGQLYLSIVNNNLGSSLSDTSKWIPIRFGIDDKITGLDTTWSSQMIYNNTLSMAIALG